MNCILGNSTVSKMSTINSQIFQEKEQRKRESICGKMFMKIQVKDMHVHGLFLSFFYTFEIFHNKHLRKKVCDI